MTPTALRRNLFQTLQRVIRGETVVVETDQGEILLIARKTRQGRPSRTQPRANAQKIPGRILAPLEQADSALRKHLRLPKPAVRSR
jgi:hypothetical protein